MKGKHIAILSVGVVVVGGIITLSITGLPSLGLSFLDGVREQARRDDLVIPVTATGTIEAAQLIQIKSKGRRRRGRDSRPRRPDGQGR